MVTITEINADRLTDQMNALYEALVGSGQDACNLMRDEIKRLARIIVNFVPPYKVKSPADDLPDISARQAGESAVERDIKSLCSEASLTLIDEVGSKYGLKGINTAWVTEKSGQRLNLKWDHLDPTGERLAEYHQEYRNSTGRIPKVRPGAGLWQARVVVPLGTRQPFIDRMKLHVGHQKATWAKVGSLLGDKYPAWISRHFSSPLGLAKIELSGETPSVLFGSFAGGNYKLRGQIQAALIARAKVVARRIALIVSGYAKDMANGLRIAAQTRKEAR